MRSSWRAINWFCSSSARELAADEEDTEAEAEADDAHEAAETEADEAAEEEEEEEEAPPPSGSPTTTVADEAPDEFSRAPSPLAAF